VEPVVSDPLDELAALTSSAAAARTSAHSWYRGHLRVTVSDGSTQLVTPRVVEGRRYAAFVIGKSLRLTRLTWLNAAGREIASTTALPRYRYTQFQPEPGTG
jgi:hypothetical protein